MICNAFERFQNALKWKNGSTDFSLSLVFPNRVTNRNLKEHVRSEYPLTSCFAVLFHFQAAFERITPRFFSFFLLLTEAIPGKR